jgi:hypothetical protein
MFSTLRNSTKNYNYLVVWHSHKGQLLMISLRPYVTLCESAIINISEVLTMAGSAHSTKKGGLKPLKAITNTTYEFAGNTTVHGITYIFDKTIFIVERILWLCVVVFFAILAIYWSVGMYGDWQDSPVLTSVKTTGTVLKSRHSHREE